MELLCNGFLLRTFWEIPLRLLIVMEMELKNLKLNGLILFQGAAIIMSIQSLSYGIIFYPIRQGIAPENILGFCISGYFFAVFFLNLILMIKQKKQAKNDLNTLAPYRNVSLKLDWVQWTLEVSAESGDIIDISD